MKSNFICMARLLPPLLLVGLCVSIVKHWGDWESLYIVLGLQLLSGISVFNYVKGRDILMFGGDFVSKDAHPVLRVWMFLVALVVYVVMFFY